MAVTPHDPAKCHCCAAHALTVDTLHMRTGSHKRLAEERDLLRAQVALLQQERDWVIDKLADHAGVTDVR